MRFGPTLVLAALALLSPILAFGAAPADGRARIRTETCGPNQDRPCGYVVWLKAPSTAGGQPLAHLKNPDPGKAGRPMLGHQLILGLKPNAQERYARDRTSCALT